MLLFNAGTVNLKKDLNTEAWCYCYLNHATKPDPFYPIEFYTAAVAILRTDLNVDQSDITLDNAENVYKHLLNIFS